MLLTGRPLFEESWVKNLALEIVVDLDHVIHGQISAISFQEHGVQPGEKGPTKHALAVFRSNRLRGDGRVVPFLCRLDEHQDDPQGKCHGEKGGDSGVAVQKPLRPDSRQVQNDGEEKEDLKCARRPYGPAMLKVGLDEQNQGREQGDDAGSECRVHRHAIALSPQGCQSQVKCCQDSIGNLVDCKSVVRRSLAGKWGTHQFKSPNHGPMNYISALGEAIEAICGKEKGDSTGSYGKEVILENQGEVEAVAIGAFVQRRPEALVVGAADDHGSLIRWPAQ